MFEYFKSTDQQIDILKSRGLIINDEKRAKEVLLRYNYYKIINATLPFFTEKSKNGKFKYREGTDFLDLYEVHHFDKELKKILLSQMLEIERIAVLLGCSGIGNINKLIMVLAVLSKYFLRTYVVIRSWERYYKIFREQVLILHFLRSFRINKDVRKWSGSKSDIV